MLGHVITQYNPLFSSPRVPHLLLYSFQGANLKYLYGKFPMPDPCSPGFALTAKCYAPFNWDSEVHKDFLLKVRGTGFGIP